ncbi:stalk domain-containing protein [Desulfotomaculum sp. 1211_IL3151]|uniref:stalk domain-containing protein n=1 Tax=Desulfotomaculum sp. 1211_IL3151 TaxID=3084055 RepID=UPI002FDA9B2D
MKKITTALITCCFILGITTGVWAEEANIVTFPMNAKKYIVNGNDKMMDSTTFTEAGRIYVPFRYLGYSLGADEKEVSYDASVNTVSLQLNGQAIVATLGSKILQVNNIDVQMDVAPLLRNGRVYLPARYIAEAQGYTVRWDANTNSVLLSKEALSENQPQITTKKIQSETDTLIVDMELPVISGLKNTELQESLNKEILFNATQNQADHEKQALEDKLASQSGEYPFRTHSLYYKYQTFPSKDMLALIIMTSDYTGGAHGSNYRQYINIDVKNGKRITLKELFKDDVDYKQIINREVAKQIKASEERGEHFFFQGDLAFKTIRDTQGFYIKGDNLVICFDQYEIAPYASGFPEFEIPLSQLKSYM